MKKNLVVAALTIVLMACSPMTDLQPTPTPDILRLQETHTSRLLSTGQTPDQYIDSIVREIGKPPGETIINYVDTKEELAFLEKEYDFMPTRKGVPIAMIVHENPIVTPSNCGKVKPKYRLSILPTALYSEYIITRNDFISGLRHEYRHIRNSLQCKVDSLPYTVFIDLHGNDNEALLKTVHELDAIGMEIIKSTGLSDEHIVDRGNAYLLFYTDLWKHGETMNPEFISQLKVDFFPPHLLEEYKKIQSQNLREGSVRVWSVTNGTTGETFSLSPSESLQVALKP